MSVLVSIITATYNGSKTIRDTIEGVLNQTYPDIEYLIIDGMSTDNTVQIAEEYRDRFAAKGYQYRIISEKDSGVYDAMNKGIRLAQGEVIGIVNSDDWYEPIAVETVVRAYEETKFDLFHADVRLLTSWGRTIIKHSKADMWIVSTRNWNHITTFVAKRIYDELGAFTLSGKTTSSDFDFYLRVRQARKKIVVRNVVIANFRAGGMSTQKTLKEAIRRCKDRYRCYENNGYSKLYWLECIFMEIVKYIIS